MLLPQGLILDRIEKLVNQLPRFLIVVFLFKTAVLQAYDIMDFYKDEEVNLICILKGSRGFFNHLMQHLNKLNT